MKTSGAESGHRQNRPLTATDRVPLGAQYRRQVASDLKALFRSWVNQCADVLAESVRLYCTGLQYSGFIWRF